MISGPVRSRSWKEYSVVNAVRIPSCCRSSYEWRSQNSSWCRPLRGTYRCGISMYSGSPSPEDPPVTTAQEKHDGVRWNDRSKARRASRSPLLVTVPKHRQKHIFGVLAVVGYLVVLACVPPADEFLATSVEEFPGMPLKRCRRFLSVEFNVPWLSGPQRGPPNLSAPLTGVSEA